MAVITISRGTLSGGQNLAECVARKLGYRIISREILVEAAKSYGVEVEKLTTALEQAPGFLENFTTERHHYLTYVRAHLTKAVKDGNVVYHGHAGHFLLKDFPAVLRVRIIANMEYRIKAAMTQHGFNREKAAEFIRKKDAERARWTRFLYHVDWLAPLLYDVVINLDEVSLSTACEIVCDAALSPEFHREMPALEREIEDAILAAEVRAAIAVDGSVGDRYLEIKAREGVVALSGTVGSIMEADKVRVLTRAVPGVKDIDSHMGIYP